MIIDDRATYDIYGTPLVAEENDVTAIGAGVSLSYRARLRQLAEYVPHPLTPEERSAAADKAWDTRGRSGELTHEEAAARFHELDVEWSHANSRLLDVLDDPDSPKYHEAMNDLKRIVKAVHSLKLDTGGLEEVGEPGGPRDVVIIGAGPSGMEAAIMAGTDGLDTLLLDKSVTPGGQPKTSSRIENYLGFPAGVTGKKLATDGFSQAERVGADTRLGVSVTGVTYDEKTGLKTVTLSTGETILTRTVIIAGGVTYRQLPFKGADNPHVNYGDGERLMLDGAGKDVVVIGGSNGAAQAAIGAARTAKSVTVLARTSIDEMSKRPRLGVEYHPEEKIQVIEGEEIAELLTDHQGRPTAIVTKDSKTGQIKRTLPAGALAIYAGGGTSSWDEKRNEPAAWLPKGVALAKDHKIVTDAENLETQIPGVFAVGDIRSGSRPRIAIAVGEGARAESGVFQYFRRLAAERLKATQAPPAAQTVH